MRFSRRSLDVLKRYSGGKGFLAKGDLDGYISEGQLTPEEYSVYIRDEDMFIEYANHALNPIEVSSLPDLLRVYESGDYVISSPVRELEKELRNLIPGEQRLIPVSLIVDKGVVEIL